MVVHKVVDNEEMTKTDVEVGDEYPGDHLHIHAELPSRKESPEMLHKPVDAKERAGAALEVADKYPREQAPTNIKVSMPATACSYKTTFLKKSTARKRLYNNRHRKHPLVYINRKEVGHDETDVVTGKMVQTDSK